MSADLQLFKFEHQPVRVILINDEPHFVARDICTALGLNNLSMAIGRLDADEKGVNSIDTPGGAQQMATVTESGMYALVLRSDKKEAARFRRWVTHKVLPEIRRTGSYSVMPAAPVALPSKKELAQWVVEAEERAELAEAKVAVLTAPASAWNELAEAQGDWAVSDAAKVLSRDPHIDIKERALFAYMAGLEWVFKRDGRWKAYRAQLDTGRLAEKVGRPFWHAGREEMVNGDATVRITPKGLQELHRRLGGSGQLELMAAVS